MPKLKYLIVIYISLVVSNVYGEEIHSKEFEEITQPISIASIQGFENYPANVKKLITKAAALTQMNLTYLYGSADPSRGGMDCSGSIYYLLRGNNAVIPRDAAGMYEWVKQKNKFHAVTIYDLQSSQFSQLKPGDLLFWSGTYSKGNESTITHVMLYLGKNKNHEPLMFGSSNGRTYQNKKMWGVSVFDFKLPAPQDKTHFVGYGCIPLISCNA